MNLVAASIEYRLGLKEKAFETYKALFSAYPNDSELRADYAAALLESGRPDEARRVLEHK